MVTGYNHNVTYRGQVFHIQTEDSGLPAAKVTTHVFLDGRIVGTQRLIYTSEMAPSQLTAHVTGAMQAQHKTMLKRLLHGDFDGVLEPATASAAPSAGNPIGDRAPPPLPAGENHPTGFRGDAARPPFSAPPPSSTYVHAPAAPLPVGHPEARSPAAMAPSEQPAEPDEYADAELIELDDDAAVDQLFAKMHRDDLSSR